MTVSVAGRDGKFENSTVPVQSPAMLTTLGGG
jgi:hypothetical protein